VSFSRAQQPEFRKLLALAWARHCAAEGIVPVPAKHDRGWYEQELFAAVRKTSTTECNAGRDYDLVMAHFEALARAGIKWQMRVHNGDGRRLLHELRAAVGEDVLDAHGVDEAYLLRVAQHGWPHIAELAELSREQCITVLGEVKRSLRRAKQHDAAEAAAIPEEALPF